MRMIRGRRTHLKCMLLLPLAAVLSCTPAMVAPAPKSVRRVAVLPPYYPGDYCKTARPMDGSLLRAPYVTVCDLLAAAARSELADQGFEVVEPWAVHGAAEDRVPTSPQMAAHMVGAAQLDATAMFIQVRQWQPNFEGMKTNGVIVALDVMLVDPKTGEVVWQVRRPPKPVPLYGVLLQGQADVFVAETVMREVLTPLGTDRSPTSDAARAQQ